MKVTNECQEFEFRQQGNISGVIWKCYVAFQRYYSNFLDKHNRGQYPSKLFHYWSAPYSLGGFNVKGEYLSVDLVDVNVEEVIY